MKKRNVAILLFDDVEVLDFAGPFEVLAVTDELNNHTIFNMFTVAETHHAIKSRNGLSVNPDYALSDCPMPDVLIVPGGYGTRQVLEKGDIIEWIQLVSKEAELVLSVCTGSLVLAKAGLLEGLQATTHHQALDTLASLAPNTKIINDKRYVDNGSIVTAAGISAGIDMCFYIIEKLFGIEYAEKTATYMEYKRT
jgi:transcriptional regulator GlxA family with amidase domain